MSYTHIMIADITRNPNNISHILHKGDYATLIREEESSLVGGVGMTFREDPKNTYSATLFLPLPPPKTAYVSMCKEIKEEIKEPCLS